MNFTSADGQFGYIKTAKPGEWQKIRMGTKEVVSVVCLGGQEGQPSTKHNHGKGKDYYNYDYHQHTGRKIRQEKRKDNYYGSNACGHDGLTAIWEFQGKQFFCAGWGKINPADYDLVLDLADQVPCKFHRSFRGDVIRAGSPSAFQALNKWIVDKWTGKFRDEHYQVPKAHANVVHFGWWDGDSLPVTTDFWEELWKLLPGTPKKPAKILVSCMGSHGRTGTCLAALMMTSGSEDIWSPQVAVLTVRSKHCEEAVENRPQIDYLNDLAKQWGMPQDAREADRVTYGESGVALERLRSEAVK